MISRAKFAKYRLGKDRVLRMAVAEAAHRISRRRERVGTPLPDPSPSGPTNFTIEEIDEAFEKGAQSPASTPVGLLGHLRF